ncbi:MAG: hypothetical protein GQ574_19650 [Crocinitomix sp.]|nr:hypothetical protein [Crocinitomix sp.]
MGGAKVHKSMDGKSAVVRREGTELSSKSDKWKNGLPNNCRISIDYPCELVIGNYQKYSVLNEKFPYKNRHYVWSVTENAKTVFLKRTEIPEITIKASRPGNFFVNVRVFNRNKVECWNYVMQTVYENDQQRPKVEPGCHKVTIS